MPLSLFLKIKDTKNEENCIPKSFNTSFKDNSVCLVTGSLLILGFKEYWIQI